MGYLNSDDMLLPGTLAYVARAAREKPESTSSTAIGSMSSGMARKSGGACSRLIMRWP